MHTPSVIYDSNLGFPLDFTTWDSISGRDLPISSLYGLADVWRGRIVEDEAGLLRSIEDCKVTHNGCEPAIKHHPFVS